MATPTAAPSDRIEETDGDITYIRTDKDLPPVAIIDRSPITTRHKIIFGIIAVLGAIAWAMIAFFRGETVNAVWFVIAAICTYVIGFRFYARFIEKNIVLPRDDKRLRRRFSTTTPLHADGPPGALRPSLRGHRRRRPARSGPSWPRSSVTCRARSGSSSGRCWRGRCRTSVVLVASVTAGPAAPWPRSPAREVGPVAGVCRLHRHPLHHHRGAGRPGLAVVKARAQSPWGTFTVGATIPDRPPDGLLPLPAPRPGKGRRDHRSSACCCCCGAVVGGHWIVGSWGAAGLHALPRSRSGGVAMAIYGFVAPPCCPVLDAALPARLPEHLHEDRHDPAAGGGHHRSPPDD